MGFTPEQVTAIEAKGKVIVSASAGSGKTTVMIEKIIRQITSGVGVDEILAVTFTNKAAASMKEKLCKAIIEEINKVETTLEKRARLKEQLSLVSTADISTIHSYCAKVIRSHFYVAGVDNAFRVIGGEDADGRELKNAALDELLEEGYHDHDEAFTHLLSVYFRRKKDATLRKTILDCYKTLRNRADYEEYLQKTALGYTEEMFNEVCADLFTLFQERCQYYYELVEDEYAYFMTIESVSEKQLALCKELMGWLEAGLAAKDYFDAARLIAKPALTDKSTSKKDTPEKLEHIEKLAFLRKRVEETFSGEFKDVETREVELQKFLATGRTAAALAVYLLKFDEKYTERKRERGVLDYNDLEHEALKLLKRPEIAEELHKKYRYVFVDEYQDVNPVQEEIISLLAADNLFLVGDVKQSIYGFRGSQSKFFVQKQKELAVKGVGESLYMKYNFRSTDAVLDAVNDQFKLAMTKRVCEVDYEHDGMMEKGGRYPTNSGKVYVHFVEKPKKETAKSRGVYSVRESTKPKYTAMSATSERLIQIIREEMMGYVVNPENGEKRPVRYSDIAILIRKTHATVVEETAALADAGIPVTTATSVNICEYTEVKTLIDILSLLDNTEQDIPLCSALLSAMGNLTADELSEIRLSYGGTFRAACKRYAREKGDALAEKLNAFYAYFEDVRLQSCVMSAGEILSKIIADTKMEAGLLSRKSGVACLKRIRRFLEEASAFDGYCVHDFLEHLRNLDYIIDYCENGGEDSVKILTMHASKGLEYPIVILPNLNLAFKGGTTPDVYVEEKYGLAPRAFDLENMSQEPNLLRQLHETKALKDSLADELNLYYVALTRAERTLHLIFTEKTPVADVKYAKNYAEMTNFKVWEKHFVTAPGVSLEKMERQALVGKVEESAVENILTAYKWEYAHTGYENLPVKSSPTALLPEEKYLPKQHFAEFGKLEEERVSEEEAEKVPAENRGAFIAEGTAYHAFLEFFDFSSLLDEEGKPVEKSLLEGLIADTVAFLQTQNVQTELLSEKKLLEILQNPVFYTLQDKRLYKEQQFMVSLPVKDTYAKKEGVDPALLEKEDGEEMLFQGALDLLAVGEEVQIIDYKYSTRGAEELKSHYKPQLDLYKLAVAKIMKIDPAVIRCSIVNIRKGFQVDMD